ncbi:MAG: hypothetical protein JW947_08230 [Sedimentisphaerales bacterium]|nr:hypothetical protein [Sedimentisphaerales bacterium]
MRQKGTHILDQTSRIKNSLPEKRPSSIEDGEIQIPPAAVIDKTQVSIEPEIQIKQNKKTACVKSYS